MANTFFANVGRIFAPHNAPVLLDCNFVVDSANGNGLGIRNLKGPKIANVFMNTSATPGVGNNGVVNPNPAAGIIMVQLGSNYSRFYLGAYGIISPLSGSNLAVNATNLTVGKVYVITSLGTSTAADWVTLGVGKGLTPAVGLSFIAAATGAGSGSGQVQASVPSGITTIETLGDPNLSIAPNVGLQSGGAMVLSQILAPTSSSVTTLIPTAPPTGTVIALSFYLSNSSVLVSGE